MLGKVLHLAELQTVTLLYVGRALDQSAFETQANDIIASVCQLDCHDRSLVYLVMILGRANQYKRDMLRRRFCCITRTIIFSAHGRVFESISLSSKRGS